MTGFADRASRPLPAPPDGPRPASFVHQQRATATGLDFDALAPECVVCGTRSPLVHCESRRCPACAPGQVRRVAAAPRRPGPSSSTASRVTRKSDSSTAERLAALQVDALEVKQWAVRRGLASEVTKGRLRGDLLDAYEAARRRDGAA